MRYLFFLGIVLTVHSVALSQTYVDYYRQGLSAYEQQDFEGFLQSFQKADSIRPNHRVLLYNLAAGYALTNQPERAYETLNYRLAFYAVNDFVDDQDFQSLVNDGYTAKLESKLEEANIPLRTSTEAFEISIDGFHAEGIAFNENTSRFYLTDIRNGWIYSVNMNGKEPKKELDLKDFGYWSAMGIKFDPVNPELFWVTTAAMPNFVGYVDSLEGKSAVLTIDMSSRELVNAYGLEGTHVFGDLIFGKDGSILVSDSGQPLIYKVNREREVLEEFVSDPRWLNLQGIALSEKEDFLYVSDYITGIYKVDLKTKKAEELSKKNEWLRGSDGIYLKGNNLVMLQNGAFPKRVASIQINEIGDGITSSTNYPDNALPELDEPTLGVVVGSSLYYIANSPWAHYDENGQPIRSDWRPLLVNKLTLE